MPCTAVRRRRAHFRATKPSGARPSSQGCVRVWDSTFRIHGLGRSCLNPVRLSLLGIRAHSPCRSEASMVCNPRGNGKSASTLCCFKSSCLCLCMSVFCVCVCVRAFCLYVCVCACMCVCVCCCFLLVCVVHLSVGGGLG